MFIKVIATPAESMPISIRNARPKGVKREIPSHEEKWLNLETVFDAPVRQGLVQPMGTTGAHPMDGFLSRVAEIEAIARTQHLELPTLAQEFAANGLKAESLSSSPDDDDTLAANIAEKHLNRTPYDPDPETLGPLMRRIEWEKYVTACGASHKVFLGVNPQGQIVPQTDRQFPRTPEGKKALNEFLAPFIPTLKELLAGRTADEIANERLRAAHYKQLVIAAMPIGAKGTPEYREYLAPADDNTARVPWSDNEDRGDGRPMEIGLHDPHAPWEPSATDLWPEEGPEGDGFDAALKFAEEEYSSSLPC